MAGSYSTPHGIASVDHKILSRKAIWKGYITLHGNVAEGILWKWMFQLLSAMEHIHLMASSTPTTSAQRHYLQLE
jgi:hypothetical protein